MGEEEEAAAARAERCVMLAGWLSA
eukprot:COSAG01_NODE_46103_length_403_cov_0.759868_1_plen_24_part_01